MTRLILLISLWAVTAQSSPVLDALHGTPRYSGDRHESWGELNDRLQQVEVAILAAAPTQELQAVLLANGQHESLWAGYVGRDECHLGPPGARCGSEDGGPPKWIGYWQVAKSSCPEAHRQPPSPERLIVEARCSVRIYAAAVERCKERNPTSGGFAGYRGPCQTTDDERRLQTYKVMLDVLRRGWPQAPPGWARDPDPTREHRRRAQILQGRPGAFVELTPEVGALVEYHWHDPSGPHRPKGWHRGVSLFRAVE